MTEEDRPAVGGGLNKRLILGIVILFFVDVVWVLSAELTEYIFHESSFNKPFFTTYVKSSLFVIYLLGFGFVKRWQYQLLHFTKSLDSNSEALLREVEYMYAASHTREGHSTTDAASSSSSTVVLEDQITLPIFENITDEESSSKEGNNYPNDETDDPNDESEDMRKVTFNSLREVRSLSTSEHSEAQVLARMSHAKINNLRSILIDVCKKISLAQTMKLALYFVVLWFAATLMYQEALAKTSAAVTNILSSTSGMFTLILSSIFPSSLADRFSLSKLAAVVISFGGIFLVCWSDPNRSDVSFDYGHIFALLGALLYACYLVLVKRKAEDDRLDVPLFLGFVGLFGLLLFWPVFFILHYTNIETFQLPAHKMTWVYLVINGVVGTVVSELLWLWGVFYTSSLMGTLSLGFVIPLTMMWDNIMNHVNFSLLFLLGTVPIIFSFIAVSILTHYGDWDPLKDLITKYICCCRTRDDGGEEREGLLSNDVDVLQVPSEIENPEVK